MCNGAVWQSPGDVTIISSRAVMCASVTIYDVLGEALPPSVCMCILPRNRLSRRTRSALVACRAALTLLFQLLTSSQLESNLNSGSNLVLDDPMSSGTVHQRYDACMGCTASSNGRGEPISSTITNRPPLTSTRAASTATSLSPCAGSSPSLFIWTPDPSSLAAARLEEAELLPRGAPNQHQLAAQVT